jgi:hypothetical protein
MLFFFQAAGNSKNFIFSVASHWIYNCKFVSMIRYSSKATFDEIILLPLIPIIRGIHFKFHK